MDTESLVWGGQRSSTYSKSRRGVGALLSKAFVPRPHSAPYSTGGHETTESWLERCEMRATRIAGVLVARLALVQQKGRHGETSGAHMLSTVLADRQGR